MLSSRMFLITFSLLIIILAVPVTITAENTKEINTISRDKCCIIRGDVAIPPDGEVLVDDAVFLIRYLYKGRRPPDCLDAADCAEPLDGHFFVNDVVYVIDYLFKAGPPPPPC